MKLIDLSAAIDLKSSHTILDLCAKCSNLFDMPLPSAECINWIMSNPEIREAGVWIDLPGDSFCFYLKYEQLEESLDKPISFYAKFASLCRKGKPYITLWASKEANTIASLNHFDFTKVDRTVWPNGTNWDYNGRAINHAQAFYELKN